MKRTGKTVITCPFCGSKNIARYLYGDIEYSWELQEKLNKGKIALAGCIEIVDISPKYQCNHCEKDFGISQKSKETKARERKERLQNKS